PPPRNAVPPPPGVLASLPKRSPAQAEVGPPAAPSGAEPALERRGVLGCRIVARHRRARADRLRFRRRLAAASVPRLHQLQHGRRRLLDRTTSHVDHRPAPPYTHAP